MSETALASHVDCDEVARLVAAEEMHLLCLERTAVAPELTADERRRVRKRIARSRIRLALLGADLQTTPDGSERNRTNLNGPGCGTHQDRTGTETERG